MSKTLITILFLSMSIPQIASAARLWQTGFELQSVTSLMEWDTTTNSPTIDTSVKRSGSASLKADVSATTAIILHDFFTHPSSTARNYYVRFYLYITSSTSGLSPILQFLDGTNVVLASIRLNSNRTLELWDDPFSSQIGSDSSALNTEQWYRIELLVTITGVNTVTTRTAYIDGSSFASGGVVSSAQVGSFDVRFGAITSTTANLNFDDVAINDNTGSSQTGLPGAGSIVHMYPNASGNNNAWLKSGGGAGNSNNYQDVDETTPDDATTYLKRTSTGTHLDEYNVQSSASAGIGSSDTITLVAVGGRIGAISNTSTNRGGVYRVKSASGGTTYTSGTVDWSINGWRTLLDPSPRPYQLISYTDPTTAVAWTPTGTNSLDNMQIGFSNAQSSTNEIRVSTIWASVEYIPSEAPPAGGAVHNAGTVLQGSAILEGSAIIR